MKIENWMGVRKGTGVAMRCAERKGPGLKIETGGGISGTSWRWDRGSSEEPMWVTLDDILTSRKCGD